MRTIVTSRRGCGRLREGGIYLLAELGGGILPVWTPIDPPIHYPGEHFRSWIAVDLDAILEGKPYEEWLVESSRDRWDKALRGEYDMRIWGMPFSERLRIGDGLLTKAEIPQDGKLRILGRNLRSLTKLRLGKAMKEVPESFKAIQRGNGQKLLAAMWRLWRHCPPSQKERAVVYVTSAMRNIGADLDAAEVRNAFVSSL